MSSFAEFIIISTAASIVHEMAFILRLEISSTIYGYFKTLNRLGFAIVLNELIFWKYLRQKILKRMIAINDDLFGVWLEISNLTIAAYLAILNTNREGFQKEFDPNATYIYSCPDIGILIFFYGLLIAQVVLVLSHSLVDFLKKPKQNQVMHINIQPGDQPQANFLPMNNQQFNPELWNWKIIGMCILTILSIWFLFAIKFYSWGNKVAEQLAYALDYDSTEPIFDFADILRPTLVAFLHLTTAMAYFRNNKKLRKFALNLILCRWQEL